MSSQYIVALLFSFIIYLSGCVPNTQVYNENSIIYKENREYSDSSIRANKKDNILFLIDSGYIQPKNKSKLSIYLKCVTKEPRQIEMISSTLQSNELEALVAESFGINCEEDRPTTYGKEIGYLYGSGYIHFVNENVQSSIQDSSLQLEFKFKSKGKLHKVVLPLKSKLVWVSPT